MSKSKIVSELLIIGGLILAIIAGAFIISKGAWADDYEDGEEDVVLTLAYVRCSSISSVCINFIYPNRFMCEAGKPPLYDCIPVNEGN